MFGNKEMKKRKKVKGYFMPTKPSGGSRKDQEWIDDALLNGILYLDEVELKKGGFFRKERFEIPTKVFKEVKNRRSKKLDYWGINEGDVRGKPKGKQIGKWLSEDIKKIKNDAIESCGIKKKNLIAEPFFVDTPLLLGEAANIPDDDIVLLIDRRDGSIRASCYSIAMLMLGEERITIYRGEYNFLRAKHFDVVNDQWWYQGVVGFGVKTETDLSRNCKLPDGQVITKASVLQMNVMGQIEEIKIDYPVLKDRFSAEPRLSFREAQVRAMRDKINEKKRILSSNTGNL